MTVRVVMIDPKTVAKLVNDRLCATYPGRQLIDGTVFNTVIEVMVEAINEVIAPLLIPVMQMNPNIDVQKLNKMVDDLKRSHLSKDSRTLDGWANACSGVGKPRPTMMVHDEVTYEFPCGDDRVDAMAYGTRLHQQIEQSLKAEPELMREWPTPTGPMTTSRAYRCANRSCPPRAAVSASSATCCYTCGKPMGES